MIETFPNVKTLTSYGGNPPMVFRQRAVLECGCFVVQGVRLDLNEPASGACSCSAAHDPMMRHFLTLQKESFAEPQSRPAIEVWDELLQQAERSWRG